MDGKSGVVYFDKHLGAAHAKQRLKYTSVGCMLTNFLSKLCSVQKNYEPTLFKVLNPNILL